MISIALLLILQSAAPQAVCTDGKSDDLDFWVGKWEVRAAGQDKVIAHSHIEKLYGGCAIRENWMPIGRPGGGSFTAYDRADGKWHQNWIDASGVRVEFIGGPKDGAMVIEGPWAGVAPGGKTGVVRMTYSRQPGGKVRQFGELTTDGGKSWTVNFDLLYSPVKEVP